MRKKKQNKNFKRRVESTSNSLVDRDINLNILSGFLTLYKEDDYLNGLIHMYWQLDNENDRYFLGQALIKYMILIQINLVKMMIQQLQNLSRFWN
jgi:hypothetical protein